MGLIKAIIILSISLVVSNMFIKYLEKNKSKPIIRQMQPYLNKQANIIIIIMLLLMIMM